MAEKKVKKAASSRKRKITTNVDKGRVYIQSSFNISSNFTLSR